MESPFAFLRLWLAKRWLPRGYAIWTWGLDGGDGDQPVLYKERR